MSKSLKMEVYKKHQKSILGSWWEPLRKWFYPTWLVYEASIRFYGYALDVHKYFIDQHDYMGDTIAQTIAITCGIATFIICTFYLTVPACFTLYEFFKDDKPANIPLVNKLKVYF